MKRIPPTFLLSLWVALTFTQLEAQPGIGINTGTPDSSAVLDIVAAGKGLLIPRMDSTMRMSIDDPAFGLMLFDSTTNSFWYHGKSGWKDLSEDDDADPNNEIQQLEVRGDTLFISEGNYLVMPGLQFLEVLTLFDIQAQLLVGITPCQLLEAGVPYDSLIGKEYQGGLIFYIDTVTCEGLVAAEMDLVINFVDFDFRWCSNSLTGATDTVLFAGASNTDSITTNGLCNPDDAADYCSSLQLNGFDDWYLPSRDELLEMYAVLHQRGCGLADFNCPTRIGEFAAASYWSSTELTSNVAVTVLFLGGAFFGSGKSNSYRVRAIRKFD